VGKLLVASSRGQQILKRIIPNRQKAECILRWAGMYIVNLISATLGVWFSAKIIGEMVLSPIIGRQNLLAAGLKPPYPILLTFAILTGYVSQVRWKGRQALWVWVLPTIYLLLAIVMWLRSGFSLADTLRHFFGLDCYPLCHDQYERTVPFYSTVAYSLGAFSYRRHNPRHVQPEPPVNRLDHSNE